MQAEWELAVSEMKDPDERVTFVSLEFSSDASAFKAANPGAELEDFLAFRHSCGLLDDSSVIDLPEDWQKLVWMRAPTVPAIEQPLLFEPRREAEKALHFLESVDATQFLVQIFHVCVWHNLDAFSSACPSDSDFAPFCSLPAVRELQAKACAAALLARPQVGRLVEEWCAADRLEAVLNAIAHLKAAVKLVASLQRKFMLLGLPPEAERPAAALAALAVAADPDWQELECPLELSLQEPFGGAPAREYLIVAGDTDPSVSPTVRMYAEVDAGHVRLATSRSRLVV